MQKSSSLILGASIVLTGLVLGLFWRSNQSMNQTITVTGSATQSITSNFGIVSVELESTEPTATKAYQELQRQIPIVLKYLTDKKFEESSIKKFPVTNWDMKEFTPSGQPTGRTLYWRYGQRFDIQSKDVLLIQSLANELSELVTKGVNIRVNQVQFLYLGLDELKISMQAKAAENAKIRANQIAIATGSSLGVLSSARMGVLQITPQFSTEVSGYGINDVSSIDKEITAVVSATFRIE